MLTVIPAYPAYITEEVFGGHRVNMWAYIILKRRRSENATRFYRVYECPKLGTDIYQNLEEFLNFCVTDDL